MPKRQDYESHTAYNSAQHPGNRARPQDVDEETIAGRVRVVTRQVLQRIVKDEEVVVSPTMSMLAYLDVNTGIIGGLEVV